MNKFSPKHYQRGKIQVWDFIADQNLDFFLGNVVKYVCRAGHKDQEGELEGDFGARTGRAAQT